MKKQRISNIYSLICNLSIIYFTIDAVWYSFRTDVIRDELWFGYTGVHSLRFFTSLSNIFVAIVAIMLLVKNIKNLVRDKYEYPHWLITLKHVATTAVAVTFVTVVVLLAPTFAVMGKGYFTLFFNNNLFMHLLTPLLAVLSYVFFEREKPVKFAESLWALLPVGLYSILYTTMVVFIGEENGGWKDFYNFTFGGHAWMIPISAIGMLLLTFGLSSLLFFCHNKWQNHLEKEN